MKKALIPVILMFVLAGVTYFLYGRDDSASSSPATPHTEEKQEAQSATPDSRHYTGLEVAKGTRASKAVRKDYTGFTLAFNPDNGTPDWVGWELLGAEAEGGAAKRSNQFWQDEELTGCPTTRDYSHSGYDRGHMCPAADQKWSAKAMSDCFVMANICPQDHSLNAGAWNTLEGRERAWAKRDSAIVIVAGPIYTESDTKRIGENKVRVPSAFYKVLLAPYTDEPRAIGFVYPNMSSPGNMADYVMSVDEIEKLTGIDFFSSLPDDIEDKVEAVASFKEWNRR